MANKGKMIGIDLGTTNSVVAIMEGSTPKVISTLDGNRVTPSIVAWSSTGEILVGEAARRQSATNPQNTFSSVKRYVGRRMDEIPEGDENRISYELGRGDDGYVRLKRDHEWLRPQEISAYVLRSLKQAAEDYLGEKVTRAVVTVPAYFNDAQRQATKDAGLLAGLEIERILTEPNAAAMAYGLDQKRDQIIAVFDLGGGTFDISILDLGGGIFDVRSTNGNTRLGGDDFDQALVEYVLTEFQAQSGIDLSSDPMSMQRLRESCEKAKRELSSVAKTNLSLPFVGQKEDGSPVHLEMSITRSLFEELIDPILDQCVSPVMQALEDAQLDPEEIDEIILVGGSTRIPRVQKMVEEIFGKPPHKGVHPDEVVAIGAAIQAGVLSGEGGELVLLDVTPLSLGLETVGGIMSVLIERNTHIPTSRSQLFTTVEDNQEFVKLKVYQGEREFVKDNRLLGEFSFTGIPPADRGVPQIEVTFDLDVDGILQVSAVHKQTGNEQTVRIEHSCSLSASEIESLRDEADQFSLKDRQHRKIVELCNDVDAACFQTEKLLHLHGHHLAPEHLQTVEDAIDEARYLTREDPPDSASLQAALRELEDYSSAIREALRDDVVSRIQGNLMSTHSGSFKKSSALDEMSDMDDISEESNAGGFYTGDSVLDAESFITTKNHDSTVTPDSDDSNSGDGTPMELDQLEKAMKLRDYQLLHKLGEGGMGSVYKALHTQLDRHVALKVLTQDRLNRSDAVARFKREMKAVGKLDHPNIVRAFDAGFAQGIYFLAMELIEGMDLARLLDHAQKNQEPIDPQVACEIVRQGAIGLQHAHEHQLVHRDIKPSNLIVSQEGVVKVLDLGLALLQTDPVAGELTESEFIMGTLDYLAPEQADDTHTVDIRADIYSLGCTLYHLLVGDVPFSSQEYLTPLNKMLAHAKMPIPSLEEHRKDIPDGLQEILQKMMAKKADDRFENPAAVAEALLPFCGESSLLDLAASFIKEEDTSVPSAKEIPSE
ncbi:Molecular chaperone DnaK [Planctomycetales bacterium 10988]|nr:Molecular chaperone DnaK [Planctomycetales bacterium 10988]